jgi:6-phosphofructokinase 1
LNALIRAVVRKAELEHSWRVIGVANGFNGLSWPEQSKELTLESVGGILSRGGTILDTTNRGNPFAFPAQEKGRTVIRDYSGQCIEGMKKFGIEALIVIGGDGTLSIAHDFVKIGIKVVGIPKTSDNNLLATETTFGFETALHVATDAIDRLQATADSHHRGMVIEVMGRDSGWIALHSGLAGGANVILIREIPFTIGTVCESIKSREEQGYPFPLVVVAEGANLPLRDARGKLFPKTQPGQMGNAIGFAI